MNNFNFNRSGRTHWLIQFLPPLETPENINTDELFLEWQKNAKIIKEYTNKEVRYRITVCELNNLVAVSFCFRNYDKTYHGIFQIGNNKDDILAIAKCMNQSIRYAGKPKFFADSKKRA